MEREESSRRRDVAGQGPVDEGAAAPDRLPPADRNDTSHDGGTGPAPTAPRRRSRPEESPTWLEILLPVLIVLLLFTLALLWNIVAALVILIIGAGVILSWVIQRRGPHEPGE